MSETIYYCDIDFATVRDGMILADADDDTGERFSAPLFHVTYMMEDVGAGTVMLGMANGDAVVIGPRTKDGTSSKWDGTVMPILEGVLAYWKEQSP